VRDAGRRLIRAASSWARIWTIALRVWPAGVALSLLSTPLVVVGGPVAAIAIGQLIDTSRRGVGVSVVVWSLVLVAATVGLDAFYSIGEYASDRLEQLVQHDADRRLLESTLRAEGIEHLESRAFLDQLQLLQASPASFANLLNNARSLLGGAIGLGLTVAALASIEPIFSVIPLVSMGAAVIDARATRRQWAEADKASVQERIAGEYESLLTSAGAAKETRLYGLAPWLRDRFTTTATAAIRAHRRGELDKARAGALRGVLHAAVLGAAAVWLVRGGVRAAYSVGEVVMGLALLRQLLDSAAVVSFVSANTTALGELSRRFDAIVEYRSPVAEQVDGLVPPAGLEQGIELDGVSFRYPGGDHDVLQQVSLRLEPGTVVALVGENGSGKTTLTKLLCRFYDPGTGTVMVDGHDLRHLSVEQWRRRIGGTLQDFAELHLVLREAVGVGRLESMEDDSRIRQAMHMASAEGIADGLDVQLGRAFDGVDLSGGQWQKVALARGFMRLVGVDDETSPLLVVLDEPAARLDVRSERDLIERVQEIARASRGQSWCTVIVSHRLASTAAADWIVVMGDGMVLEQGTHEELLRRGGAYAELFSMSSTPYLDTT
jgi:ABC-type multidrug transport system fused ATPase/permease subunit